MKRFTLLLAVAILGCSPDGVISDIQVRGKPSAHKPWSQKSPLTLEAAQRILANRTESTVGSISLDGYSFHRVVELGRGLRIVVISRNLGGGLLLFDSTGAHIATKATNEIRWLQLFDIDEDGLSELMTEEIDGRGTGILETSYCLYRFAPERVEPLWHGESYSRLAPTPGLVEEHLGFIRFDPSASGRHARLTHVIIGPTGLRSEITYEWRNNALQAVFPNQ
jgi:hypothetical protein